MLKRSLHTDPGISIGTPRRSMALLLLAVQLVGGLGIPWHTHAFALRLVADPILAAHECGEQEHHIPLDSIHPCVICGQLYQRSTLPVESMGFTAVYCRTAGLYDIAFPPVITGDHLFPEKRGPPAIA